MKKNGGRKSCWTVPLIKSIVKAKTLLTFLLLNFFYPCGGILQFCSLLYFSRRELPDSNPGPVPFQVYKRKLAKSFCRLPRKGYLPPRPNFFSSVQFTLITQFLRGFLWPNWRLRKKSVKWLNCSLCECNLGLRMPPPPLKSVYNLVGRETQTGFKFYIIFHNWRRIFVVVLYYNNEL